MVLKYMLKKAKGNVLTGNQPLTLSGLAEEGRILFPVLKDKEAVKVETGNQQKPKFTDRGSQKW